MSLRIAAISLIVICFLTIPVSPVATSTPQEPSQSTSVERIWEQGIAAKGGREALHGVRSFVITSQGEYRSRAVGKNKIRQEVIYALPDKFWSWSDYRPDVFGLRVQMYNYETSMKYTISEGDPYHPLEPIDEKDRSTRDIPWALMPYFLETKWLKPELLGVKEGRVGPYTVNIVETSVRGRRVDFAFDQKTHLPIRVSYYSTNKNGTKTYITTIDLADYVDIGGIKLPQTLKYYDGTKHKQRYQVNVGYNEDIFTKLTKIEDGLEVWTIKN